MVYSVKKVKRLKRDCLPIKMFKEIKFGDIDCFDEEKLGKNFYSKKFENEEYIVKGYTDNILYVEDFKKTNGDTSTYEISSLKLFLGKNKEVLETIYESDLPVENIKKPKITTCKKNTISTTGKRAFAYFKIAVNNKTRKIKELQFLGSAQFADIYEFYNKKNELIGIIYYIPFTKFKYEEALNICKGLFNIK